MDYDNLVYILYLEHRLVHSDHSVTKSILPSRLNAGSYYRCENSNEWISVLAKCDETIDCLDASDEIGCLRSGKGNFASYMSINSQKII